MSLSDPIADMLTRIRNALTARHEVVNVRASKVCQGVCRVLKDEGYIEDFKLIEDNKQGPCGCTSSTAGPARTWSRI